MTTIELKQNESLSLDLLAAQNAMYGVAKNKLGIFLVLSIPVMVIVNLAVKPLVLSWYGLDITNYIALYALGLSAFDAFYLKNYISQIKQKAAKIQEKFDCYVYGLAWNVVICGSETSDIDVKKYSDLYYKKHKGNRWLVDWYSKGVDELEGHLAPLACQRENLGWDIEQRQSFSNAISILAVLILVVSLVYGYLSNYTLEYYISSVFIPCWPLMVYAMTNHFENKEAIADKYRLKEALDNTLSSSQSGLSDVRQIQDLLYINRKNNPLIFDWYYGFCRDKNHAGIQYATKKLIQSIVNS